ncbi:hypothetical protein VZT92_001270 [Zoarces viviparus]|uniref:Protein FAM161A n=1 Tax=Zoarces viviparus TaxID=48416 RepID=A0AAW1G254_ZOAVI
MYRSTSLQNKDLMALYGGGGGGGGGGDHYCVTEEDCSSEVFDPEPERGEEEGRGGRSIRRSLSLEIYGLQREPHVHFSNQQYYRRLEELKSAHLRNMAQLQRMYIGQGRERQEEEEGGLGGRQDAEDRLSVSSGPARKLQRINSQEELDFHDTSSASDQSELCGADSMGELDPDDPRGTPVQDRTVERGFLLSPEEMPTREQFRFQTKASCPKPQGRPSRQTGVRVRSNSKATVPKPFQMMLREEGRKRHKVRTRSEIELENTLLRRELEELQECQKKFRASPAPAHIHLPLYEMISRCPARPSDRSRSGDGDRDRDRDPRSNRAPAAASPRPFHFLERERRKREAKMVAELGKLGPKEERGAFRARPMPSSVHGTKPGARAETTSRQYLTLCPLEREATEGRSDPNSDPEPDHPKSDTSPDSRRPRRCPSSKPAKKQIELSIEMVKEREWSSTDPPSLCSLTRVTASV